MLRALRSCVACAISKGTPRWTVRYFVVDTGGWLPGRKVLISPASVREVDGAGRRLDGSLTRQQVLYPGLGTPAGQAPAMDRTAEEMLARERNTAAALVARPACPRVHGLDR